jgi:gliding motility-associated-like protein
MDSIAPGQINIRFNGPGPVTIPDDDVLFTLSFEGINSGSASLAWDNFLPGICGIMDSQGIYLPPGLTAGTLEVYPKDDAIIFGNRNVCEGSEILLSTPNTSLVNTWTLPDGSTQSSNLLTIASSVPSDSGDYSLTSVNTYGCIDQETLKVDIHPNPEIQISEIDPLCAEGHYDLTPGDGFDNYTWQDGSTDKSFSATGEGVFWVTVTDVHGCEATDSTTLVTCPAALLIPTAFSPNGDGKNEVFRASYTDPDVLGGYKLLIFNRWGELLFETNIISQGWDGTWHGKECPSGLYSYLIYFKKPENRNFSQESPIRGMVTLLK